MAQGLLQQELLSPEELRVSIPPSVALAAGRICMRIPDATLMLWSNNVGWRKASSTSSSLRSEVRHWGLVLPWVTRVEVL